MILTQSELDLLLRAQTSAPHDLLGMHRASLNGRSGVVVRALLRGALKCEVVSFTHRPERRFPMKRLAREGFFEAFIEESNDVFQYRLRVEQENGEFRQFYDPYSFLPTLSEQDLYLFSEGTGHLIYQKLGAHCREIKGVRGVSFAVWAPNAKRVSVVGDFNHWDGRYHLMRSLGTKGVWEIFLPGLEEGVKYKFELCGYDGILRLKTDPFATSFEPPPDNAARVHDVDCYSWHDDAWLQTRQNTEWRRCPLSIYEVHLGSWKRQMEDAQRPLNYVELAEELPAYVKQMGFTHVEFLPLAEHPFTGSWGYQVTGFFAPTCRFGPPQDFMHLVDELHRHDIGVIMDWVPGHFPRDSFALASFDGTQLYEHSDPKQGVHQDWGTLIFNYERPEVRCFLTASALAWFDRYHIDGLRVDAVASMLYLDYSRRDSEWIPNKYGGRENLDAIRFLRSTNEVVHQSYPGALMIAEESTSWAGVTRSAAEGGLDFDLKWNMGWMHDILQYFSRDPIYRKWHHHEPSFTMLYQFSERFLQVFSHDEVVHGKGSLLHRMPGLSITQKAHGLRGLYTFMWLWPGKKTLFMGCEFGQSEEWHYDRSLDWHLLQFTDHRGIQTLIRDLNRLYRSEPALHQWDLEPEGFEWVDADDADSSVFSFLRREGPTGEVFLVVGHFSDVTRCHYRVGVPFCGFWREVLNSDAREYGGSGTGNLGGLSAQAAPAHGHRFSLPLTLPPLATVAFKWQSETAAVP